MEISKPHFAKHLFVCENIREEGVCCAKKDSAILREALKVRIKQMGLSDQIRVSRSGCLDVCAEGPNVLLMPDNVWFKKVGPENLEEILDHVAKND